MQKEGSINNVQEEVQISSVGEVASHALKHSSNKVHPHVFMQLIKTPQLLQMWLTGNLLAGGTATVLLYLNFSILVFWEKNCFTKQIREEQTNLAHGSSLVQIEISLKGLARE